MNEFDRQPEDHDMPEEQNDLVDEPQSDPMFDARPSHAPSNVSSTSVFCIQCGYNLTGVAIGSNCPECGRKVAPSFHGQVLPTSGKAVASMVLGICSIVLCMFYGLPALICGPLAIVFSILAKKQVERGEAGSATSGMAAAGMICGTIGLLLALLFIGLIVFAIVAGSF